MTFFNQYLRMMLMDFSTLGLPVRTKLSTMKGAL